MPISTISYNTEEFLKQKLDDLISAKIIEFYFYVPHKGEDDEAGKKDHIHVYMQPCSILDTSLLIDEFIEHDLSDLSAKPKKSLPIKSSKPDDAIMYFIHDRSYLAYKGESRKYHYRLEDVRTSDIDEFNYYFKSIDLTKITPYKRMLDAQELGMNFADYLKKGSIPIQQISNYQKAWYLLKAENVERNGRKGHDILDNDFVDSVNLTSGEVSTK